MSEEELEIEEEKKEKQQARPAGAPMWMVTYSDLVTLLLTFFVLLLSMANMDPVKFNAATQSMRDAFGMHREQAQIEFSLPVIPSRPKTKFMPINPQQTSKIHAKVKAQIEALKLGKEVSAIKKDSSTLILRIQDPVLFAPGSAKLHPNSYPTLRKVSDILRPLPADIRIEGHTDDMVYGPGPLASWNLSTDRAVAVMRFIKQGQLLPLERMAAVGFGADQPVTPNIDEDSRAKNRRVDFILKLKNPDQEAGPIDESAKIPL